MAHTRPAPPAAVAALYVTALLLSTTAMMCLLPFPKAKALLDGQNPALSLTETVGAASMAFTVAFAAYLIAAAVLFLLQEPCARSSA